MEITKEIILANTQKIAQYLESEGRSSSFGGLMVKMLDENIIADSSDMYFSCIEDYASLVLDMVDFSSLSKKDSHLVALFNAAHENETYDVVAKEFKNN